MTDTTTTEEPPATPASETETPALPAAEKASFWHRPLVEKFLVPLVVPVAVVVGIVFYVLNVSRLFLSAHGHIPVIIGTVITVLILAGATLLSANAEHLRRTSYVLLTAGFIMALTFGGWISLGHSQPKETGPATLPATLKTTQTQAVTVAPAGALTFQPLAITAKTGLVKFNVTFASTGHTFGFHDPSTLFAELKDVSGSGVAFFPAPGDYVYFCSIPGHEQAGMHGVVHVSGAPTTLAAALQATGNPPLK